MDDKTGCGQKVWSSSVLYEHEDFYVCLKPAGLDFHDNEVSKGFFNQIAELFPSERLYPVHRLDKGTSGLLLIARNKDGEAYLSSKIKNREIEKLYVAISNAKPKKKQGTVKGDMIRSRRKSWKLLRSCENPAITQFFSYGLGEGYRLFVIKIISGKTHQIRVALKSLGAPVVGDDIYSGLAGENLYLHAWSLQFEYKNEKVSVQSYPGYGELWVKYQKNIVSILEGVSGLCWPKVKDTKKE